MMELTNSLLYNQLRLVYGEAALQIVQVAELLNEEEYLYFPVYQGIEVAGWIGVRKEFVSEDAQQLIRAFIQGETQQEQTVPQGQKAEQKAMWQRIIRQPLQQWLPLWNADGGQSVAHSFCHLYVFIENSGTEWEELYTNLCEVFEGIVEGETTYFLPLDKHQYVWIIADHTLEVTTFQKLLEDLHDTLTSDLLLNSRFVLAEQYEMPCDVRSIVAEDQQKIYRALSFGLSRPILSMRDLDPYLLLSEWEHDKLSQFVNRTLGPIQEDEELLLTVSTYFKENLNVSETAKKLYIHRNSLQYRLDKFTDRTGIDLRTFEQAVNVYLAILATGKLNKDRD